MSGRTFEETINGFREFPVVGRSFELLFTQQPVDVVIRRGAEVLESWQNVEAGTKHTVRDGQAAFNTIEITTPASEVVKFAVSDGETEYDPRAHWYDRNPIARANAYAGEDIAPHGATTRWTYTVPTGKKTYVEMAWLEVMRKTAGAPVGELNARLTYTPSGASAISMLGISMFDNTPGAREHITLGGAALMYAGDALAAVTADDTTGGTAEWRITAKMTEFNS